ncbi:hypothetical protein TRAPUB_9972 [Trametes pubescens]|uniref:MYND-type domain-containing protein n=1 Tax=Trametes pubescens TaxID=154538 RepID=A0A1M2W0V7_TRAPU|nr:hypothetical protein TRAPUB_9972 [Trametes pubescens]
MPQEETPICHKCRQPPRDGSKLRKCGGCTGILYCSKECQKAAWPAHRVFCLHIADTARDFSLNDHEVQRFGYASCAAFTRTMSEFITAHTWAVDTTVEVQALLQNGPALALPHGGPQQQLYLIELACADGPLAPRPARNPAAAFKVAKHGFMPLEEYLRTDDAQNAAQTHAAFLRELSMTHAALSAQNYPLYAGLMPVMFEVSGVLAHLSRRVPIFRPIHARALDAVTTAALGDLVRLCVGSINGGAPLGNVDIERPHFAIPGQFARRDGKWAWTRQYKDWAHYHRMSAECGVLEMVKELQFGWAPEGLMDVYATFYEEREPR